MRTDREIETLELQLTESDLRCALCGYGIAARKTPPGRCPMCGTGRWLPVWTGEVLR